MKDFICDIKFLENRIGISLKKINVDRKLFDFMSTALGLVLFCVSDLCFLSVHESIEGVAHDGFMFGLARFVIEPHFHRAIDTSGDFIVSLI